MDRRIPTVYWEHFCDSENAILAIAEHLTVPPV